MRLSKPILEPINFLMVTVRIVVKHNDGTIVGTVEAPAMNDPEGLRYTKLKLREQAKMLYEEKYGKEV